MAHGHYMDDDFCLLQMMTFLFMYLVSECNIVCHPKCTPDLPASCGLPTEYAKHFTDMMSRARAANDTKVSVANLKLKMDGWMKMPKYADHCSCLKICSVFCATHFLWLNFSQYSQNELIFHVCIADLVSRSGRDVLWYSGTTTCLSTHLMTQSRIQLRSLTFVPRTERSLFTVL